MARDPRKQQRKVERRKAKQKAKKRALARQEPQGLASHLERAATAPILHCRTSEALWDSGIGPVLVSRELPNRKVTFGMFLVDMYCLGVKDAWSGIFPRSQYDWKILPKAFPDADPVDLRPECARKLVEGAVAYAADLGFAPHADYRRTRLIFGDIDPFECRRTFVYGSDGKPFFVAGPYDSAARCREIMATLQARCGPDGFHYMMDVDQAGVPLGETRGRLLDED